MDRLQISEMKTAIKREYETKINKLREEMEFALSSLGKVEQTLFSSDADASGLPESKIGHGSVPARSRRTRFPTKTKPSVLTRIKTALVNLDGEFTRNELKERTERDGYGEIPSNTFAPTFKKLKKEEICLVAGPHGTQAGIYRKADDVKPGIGHQDQ